VGGKREKSKKVKETVTMCRFYSAWVVDGISMEGARLPEEGGVETWESKRKRSTYQLLSNITKRLNF